MVIIGIVDVASKQHNILKERGLSMEKLMKFKGFCAENGIKQMELAKLLEITPANMSEKMNGKQPFTLMQVKKICETYEISADEYFI